MKNTFLFILFLFSLNQAVAQEDAWVYFTDKPDATSYLANPLTMLSQRALDRRANQNIDLDVSDVPISATYRTQISNTSGITVMAQSKWLNALHIRGSISDILSLTSLSFVSEVQFANHTLNSRSTNAAESNATQDENVFSEVQITYNYGNSSNQIQMLNGEVLHQEDHTGQGKIIAVLDSGFLGVDTVAPFQNLQNNNQILGGYNFVDGNTNIYSNHNHGTMVLSTMGGFVDGELVGTAPDAYYYLFITEDVSSENPVEESYWVEAAEKADSLGVDIINSSLGYRDYDNTNYSYSYAMLNGEVGFASRGAAIAFEKGIVCVISAGNNGATGNPYIGIPADAKNVLTVGAVDSSENIANFSSIGYTADGRIKPDVCAKGVSATISNTSGNIITASGTSFSSPILAGMIASFWSAVPDLTAAQVIEYVKQSSDQFTTPDAYKGYGIPDFSLALASVLNTPSFVETTSKLFPNPMQNTLTITVENDTDSSFSLYNCLGKKVLATKLDNMNTKIDVSNLKSGVYFYEMSSKKSTLRGKLIKQ